MVFLSGEVLVSWRREFLDVKTTSRILEGLLAWRGSVEPRKGLVEAACGAEQGHRLRELVRPRPECAGDKGRTGAACTQRTIDERRLVVSVPGKLQNISAEDGSTDGTLRRRTGWLPWRPSGPQKKPRKGARGLRTLCSWSSCEEEPREKLIRIVAAVQ